MNKNFSLAFPVIRLIHAHHTRPHEHKAVRVCQQQLIDRIFALALPFLAAFDALFHCTAFMAKGIQAIYRSLVWRQEPSFGEAIRHLKIARLFSAVTFRCNVYLIYPKRIDLFFDNCLSRFVQGLLLSGSRGIFENPSNAGATTIENGLKHFCATVKDLPDDIKQKMAITLALVEEACEFIAPFKLNDRQLLFQIVFQKIRKLDTHRSLFIPMSVYADDPSKHEMHAYYVIITKLANHYRFTTINRGWGMNWHLRNAKKQASGDLSYDNVPFEQIENQLKSLFLASNHKDASQIYETAKKTEEKSSSKYSVFQKILYNDLFAEWILNSQGITTHRSHHYRSEQKIGNCVIASLMGAISYHSAMQTGNLTNKTDYKKFIYAYKKLIFSKYNYLLDFSLETKQSAEFPSAIAQNQLDKMKRKLADLEENKS